MSQTSSPAERGIYRQPNGKYAVCARGDSVCLPHRRLRPRRGDSAASWSRI